MKNVHISDTFSLNEKIKSFQELGLSNLHVVSDFDRTLTKSVVNGKKLLSIFAVIREGDYLGGDYSKKAFALFDKYHPFEVDDSISIDFKISKMNEWWSSHLELLIDSGMSKEIISKILIGNSIPFRNGSDIFFNFLAEKDIPLLIFSAGLGDLINGYLRKDNFFTKNIHVISNFFKFDSSNFLTGYDSKIVHPFNKNEIQIKGTNYYKETNNRTNVILLGDSLGDLGMTKGIFHDNIIRIGFLNGNIEKNLSAYEKRFDVVLLNDTSMDYVNQLLKKI